MSTMSAPTTEMTCIVMAHSGPGLCERTRYGTWLLVTIASRISPLQPSGEGETATVTRRNTMFRATLRLFGRRRSAAGPHCIYGMISGILCHIQGEAPMSGQSCLIEGCQARVYAPAGTQSVCKDHFLGFLTWRRRRGPQMFRKYAGMT